MEVLLSIKDDINIIHPQLQQNSIYSDFKYNAVYNKLKMKLEPSQNIDNVHIKQSDIFKDQTKIINLFDSYNDMMLIMLMLKYIDNTYKVVLIELAPNNDAQYKLLLSAINTFYIHYNTFIKEKDNINTNLLKVEKSDQLKDLFDRYTKIINEFKTHQDKNSMILYPFYAKATTLTLSMIKKLNSQNSQNVFTLYMDSINRKTATPSFLSYPQYFVHYNPIYSDNKLSHVSLKTIIETLFDSDNKSIKANLFQLNNLVLTDSAKYKEDLEKYKEDLAKYKADLAKYKEEATNILKTISDILKTNIIIINKYINLQPKLKAKKRNYVFYTNTYDSFYTYLNNQKNEIINKNKKSQILTFSPQTFIQLDQDEYYGINDTITKYKINAKNSQKQCISGNMSKSFILQQINKNNFYKAMSLDNKFQTLNILFNNVNYDKTLVLYYIEDDVYDVHYICNYNTNKNKYEYEYILNADNMFIHGLQNILMSNASMSNISNEPMSQFYEDNVFPNDDRHRKYMNIINYYKYLKDAIKTNVENENINEIYEKNNPKINCSPSQNLNLSDNQIYKMCIRQHGSASDIVQNLCKNKTGIYLSYITLLSQILTKYFNIYKKYIKFNKTTPIAVIEENPFLTLMISLKMMAETDNFSESKRIETMQYLNECGRIGLHQIIDYILLLFTDKNLKLINPKIKDKNILQMTTELTIIADGPRLHNKSYIDNLCIKTPDVNITTGGKAKNKHKYKNKLYNILTGPNGGQYIIVKGKKKYI